MNAHFTSQFQTLKIKGIYSPKRYSPQTKTPRTDLLAPNTEIQNRGAFTGDSTSHCRDGDFVQVINLSFTLLNNLIQ